MASHRALTAAPEARSPRSPSSGSSPADDLLDIFRTPATSPANPVVRDDFAAILGARQVAVLERPQPRAVSPQAPSRPVPLPEAPTAGTPRSQALGASVPQPATPGTGAPEAPVFRSRAERRAAERSGQTPPWGVPVVAVPSVQSAVSAVPVTPPPSAVSPVPAPAVLPAHHVIPVSGAVPPGSIDPHLFDDNARTAPQPLLPSRRELRQRETARRPQAAEAPEASRGKPEPKRSQAQRSASGPVVAEPARPTPTRQGARASHVAIVGTLGIATIAVPLSGALTPPAAEPVTASVPAVMPAAPEFPGLVREPTSVDALTVLPSTRMVGGALPQALARPRLVLVDGGRASRGNERSVLPGCDGKVAKTNAGNGQLDVHDLCTLWNRKHRLRADAAVALAKLNIAYERRFGHDICLTDSYRTLSEQRRLKAIKPGLAATPGTSEHGWGLAVDMCDNVERGSSLQYRWLRANAADFGWANPDWALPGGSGPYEPWHWEFVAGE